MKNIKLILIGMMIGIANVIPGVSGGTIAIIFNIYDRLMECITLKVKVIFDNLDFLIPLGTGVAIGILGLSKIMEILFENYPQHTYFAFIGIIIGSLPLIYSKATKGNKQKLEIPSIIIFIFTLVLMVLLSFVNADKSSGTVLFTTLTPLSFVALFVSMIIGTATMIIPGISGSMLLIVMGMYQTIYFEAINNFNIPLLIPSFFGGVTGLLLGAKLIRFLLGKYNQITYMGIMGLLVGSAYQLFLTNNISEINLNLGISILIMMIMAMIIYWFSINEIKEDKKII
ncbi:MAG: DUF368 domain-containing protein [Erysipelotrichaceae bacterium]|nr:DUF368 domain-containing protein [Erysipelotrichaceae bacterium]